MILEAIISSSKIALLVSYGCVLNCELDVGQGTGNTRRARQRFSEGLQSRQERHTPPNHRNVCDRYLQGLPVAMYCNLDNFILL